MALEAGSVYAVLGGRFMPTGFAQFDAAMKKSSASAAAAEAQIGRSSGRSAAAMGALGTAARTGAAAGLVAVGVAAVSSVKSAQKFEKQISELRAVTRASSQDMATMRKAALDLGASTGVGATEAARALTELAKGGLSSKQAIGALKGTIAMAQAGGMDFAQAGETVANALNLFKLRGEDATMVADSFANAANATTADIGFFAQGMAQGGAAAKAAGLDFQQTTVFLEAMAANGFKSGSDAGTSMKTALIQLANPTKRAQEAAKQLGVSFFDSQGQIRPLPALAKDLGNAFEGMSKKEKLATATRLVGTDGMRALLALADQGPAKLKAFAAANAESGSAARVAGEKMNNFEGSMKKLNASLETLKIEAGTTLTPTLKRAADALADLLGQARGGQGVIGLLWKGLNMSPLEDIQRMSQGGGFGTGLAESLRSKVTPAALTVLGAIRAIVGAISAAAGVGGRFNPFRGMKPAADAALRTIDGITGKLRALDKQQTRIKLIADNKAAIAGIRKVQNSKINQLVAKILADDQPFKVKYGQLRALKIPAKIAKILAESKSAEQALARVKARLNAIQSKTVEVRTVYTETGRLPKSGVRVRAAGRQGGSAETSLVGEGGGPEYVVNSRTGQSMRVDRPMLMGLGPDDYVIPTESKYRGRANSLLVSLAEDLGIVGYESGKARKERIRRLRARQDKRINIQDTKAGMYGTMMDTAQIEYQYADWAKAQYNRLQALKAELKRINQALTRKPRPTGQRKQDLLAKKADINNAIASTTRETFAPPEADTGLTQAEQGQIDAFDAAIALAALTDPKTDDLTALQAKEGGLKALLDTAQRTGRAPRVIADLAGQLKSTRDEITSLTAPPDMTADQQAQSEQTMNRDRIAAQNDIITRLVNATIGGAGNTLVFQSYVPPSPTEAKRLADYTVGGIGYQGGTPSSTERIGV